MKFISSVLLFSSLAWMFPRSPVLNPARQPVKNGGTNLSVRAAKLHSADSRTLNADSTAFLLFPLPNQDAYSASIDTVFDHSQTAPYAQDMRVVAFTGEEGICSSDPDQLV